jgi:hypothetical protein
LGHIGEKVIWRSDFQRILDNQVQLEQPIKLGLSVGDGERCCESWFTTPVLPGRSMEEHRQNLINIFQERIQNYFTTWAILLLVSSSQDYREIVKAVNETVESWYTPIDWLSDDVVSVAYQAVPKEWIAF